MEYILYTYPHVYDFQFFLILLIICDYQNKKKIITISVSIHLFNYIIK